MSDLPTALAFLGVQALLEEASIGVLPVPYDLTTTYQPGARFGPRAILTASHAVELFDEELRWDVSRAGVHTLQPLEPLATGPEAMTARIADKVATLFASGKFPLLIGGDHSITIGALEALSRHWENPWVLQFDAHADLRESYQGSPFSHACVMARARENFSCVQVGIRSWSEEEDARLWEHPERILPASEIEENPRAAAARLEQVLGDPVYVTLDLDCLDPTCMPATGTPEPGGLSWRSLTRLLRLVAQRRHVVGCDICELSPIPGFVAPDFLAARLAAKMIAYVFQPRSESGG